LVHQPPHFVYATFSNQCSGRNATKQFLGSKDELAAHRNLKADQRRIQALGAFFPYLHEDMLALDSI
jgi:hypothetical protein